MSKVMVTVARLLFGATYLIASVLFSNYFSSYNLIWIALASLAYFTGTRAVIFLVLSKDNRGNLLNGFLARSIQIIFGAFLVLLTGIGVFIPALHMIVYYVVVVLMGFLLFKDSKLYSGAARNAPGIDV